MPRDADARVAAFVLDVKALTWTQLAWYAQRGNDAARAELRLRPQPQGVR